MPYILALILLLSSPAFANKRMSDGEVREAIIRESIANFKGICPCPYSMHPDGKQCGHRSAFSRGAAGAKGGSVPICYEINITLKMVEEYRLKTALMEIDPSIKITPTNPNPK